MVACIFSLWQNHVTYIDVVWILEELECMVETNWGERETGWKIDLHIGAVEPCQKKIFSSTLTYGSTQEQLNIIVFTHAAMQKTEQCSGLFFFYFFVSLADKKRTPHWRSVPFACMRIKWVPSWLTHAARFDATTLAMLLLSKIYPLNFSFWKAQNRWSKKILIH